MLDWLGREDLNLRMAESKSAALPLGDAPIAAMEQGCRLISGRVGLRHSHVRQWRRELDTCHVLETGGP